MAGNDNRRELPPLMKNEAFACVQAEGLDWAEFQWELVKGPWAFNLVSRLYHPRTGFYFLFDASDHGFAPQGWPGGQFGSSLDSRLTMDYFRQWVKEILAPEINAPDMWKLAAEQKGIGTDPSTANTPLTIDEQRQLSEGFRQLEAYVDTAEPLMPAEKRRAVAARFEYLRGAAPRLGRVDWITLVVGQLFGMASEQIVTVQTFTALYHLASGLVGQSPGAAATPMQEATGPDQILSHTRTL
jgi:hypothetical protein